MIKKKLNSNFLRDSEYIFSFWNLNLCLFYACIFKNLSLYMLIKAMLKKTVDFSQLFDTHGATKS